MKPYLSVIIPAYNEAINIHDGLLEPAFAYLKKQTYPWEVIFVNDGSTDKTLELLHRLAQKNKNVSVLDISHGGKATAVRKGMLAAKGDFVLFTDLDQSTPLSQVEKFLKAHQEGAQVVIGVRGEGTFLKNDTFFRKIRSKVFVTLVQIVAVPGIRDSQCGFKSFRHDAARRVFSSLKVCVGGKITGGYMGAFDVEALFLSKKFGYKISQVPVDWIKVASEKLDPVGEPIKMAIDTFKIRLFDIFGLYKSA